MSARHIPVGDDSGFTLLELLVTLALLSLLSLTLFGSIRYGTRIWEAARGLAASTENVRHAQQTLARLISTAYPKFIVKDATHASIAFNGQADSLELLAPDMQVPGALDQVRIYAGGSDGEHAIVVERKLELSADSVRAVPEILVTGVATLEFQYFGALKAGGKREWKNTWSNSMRPPLLIQITAVLADRRVEWPELTVAPQIVADVTCTIDAISGFCEGR